MAFKDLLPNVSRKGLSKDGPTVRNVRAWIGRKVDQKFLDHLEATLIKADVGVQSTASEGCGSWKREAFADKTAEDDLIDFVKAEFRLLLADPRPGALAGFADQADGLLDRWREWSRQDDFDCQASPAA